MTIRSHSFVEGNFYHIYAHSVGDLKIFRQEKDYTRFLSLLFSANNDNSLPRLDRQNDLNLVWDIRDGKIDFQEPLVDIVCFCLMPTHFHLLLGERGNANISKYLHRVLVSHSKYFNLKYKRRGHLFESKFHSKYIQDDNYLLVVSSYIHKNAKDLPGWKSKEDQYFWSSYQDYILENRWGKLLNKEIIEGQLSGQVYKNFVEDHYRELE